MKKQEIITLRNQGKTWKEISARVNLHPSYLSAKFGKKAKRAKKLEIDTYVPRSMITEAYNEKETTAKDLIKAIRFIQDNGGTVNF